MPLLQQLHWLPINKRIRFKLAVLTYKVRATKILANLGDLVGDIAIIIALTIGRTVNSMRKPSFSHCCTNHLEQFTR